MNHGLATFNITDLQVDYNSRVGLCLFSIYSLNILNETVNMNALSFSDYCSYVNTVHAQD